MRSEIGGRTEIVEPAPIPTRLAEKVRSTCGDSNLVKVGKSNKHKYTLTMGKHIEFGTTQHTLIAPKMMRETRTKVLVLFQTANGGGLQQTLNLLANYLLGVSYKDDFLFKLPKLKIRENYLVAFPRLEDSPVPFNLLIVVAGVVQSAKLISKSTLLNHLIVNRVIDEVDCYLAALDSDDDQLDHADWAVLQAVPNGKSNLMLLAPQRQAANFNEIVHDSRVKACRILFLAFEPQTQQDYTVNQGSFAVLFAKLKEIRAKQLVTSVVVTDERMQLEDNCIAAYESMLEVYGVLSELRNDLNILRAHRDSVRAGEAFEGTYQMTRRSFKKMDNVNTYCLKCKVVCHEKCNYENDGEKYKCWAMSEYKDERDVHKVRCVKGNCLGAATGNGCSWMCHKNMMEIEEVETFTVTRTSADLAKYYDKDEKRMQSLEKMLKHNHKEQVQTLLFFINKSRCALNRLSEIGQDRKQVTLLESVKAEMENELTKKQDGYVDRIQSLFECAYNALAMMEEACNQALEIAKPLKHKRHETRRFLKAAFVNPTEETAVEIFQFTRNLAQSVSKVLNAAPQVTRKTMEKVLNEILDDVTQEEDPFPEAEVQLGITNLERELRFKFTYASQVKKTEKRTEKKVDLTSALTSAELDRLLKQMTPSTTSKHSSARRAVSANRSKSSRESSFNLRTKLT